MKKSDMFFTDGSDFVYLPNKEIHKKLFNNSKNAVIYFRRIKNKYNVETTHITLHDLTACGYVSIKELPKNIYDLLNNVLNCL